MAAGTLTVEVLDEGVHSGDASGVVPSSFRILRQLLSRLEDEATGAIRPPELYAQIPPERVAQAQRAAAALGDAVYTKFPFVAGMTPVSDDLTELVLNRTWRPQLAVTGIDGLPTPADAGNVLLPYTAAKLSLRLPPTLDADSGRRSAAQRCSRRTRPTARRSSSRSDRAPPGWNAPALAPWLEASLGARLAGCVRRAARLYGRGRQHPVHGDARREIPAGAVRRHRRARAAFQRARPERIPAHPDRQARHAGDRPGAGRPFRPARGKIGPNLSRLGITRRFRRHMSVPERGWADPNQVLKRPPGD